MKTSAYIIFTDLRYPCGWIAIETQASVYKFIELTRLIGAYLSCIYVMLPAELLENA